MKIAKVKACSGVLSSLFLLTPLIAVDNPAVPLSKDVSAGPANVTTNSMAAEPIRIGKEHQLFLDNYLIEKMTNVTRRVCPVRKYEGNPVIARKEEWEPQRYIFSGGTVMYDEEEKLYKLWINGQSAYGLGVYYFTSQDGIRWDKPETDQFKELDGRATHRVVCGCDRMRIFDRLPKEKADLVRKLDKGWQVFNSMFSVIKDPREDPSRRYKLGFLWSDEKYQVPGTTNIVLNRVLGVAFSPDGIHWKVVNEPASKVVADGTTHIMFDQKIGRFVLYGRCYHMPPARTARYSSYPDFEFNDGRAVNRAESTDFLKWEPDKGKVIFWSSAVDDPMEEIYGMCPFIYEGIYIALIEVLHINRGNNWMDIRLGVSRDGIKFDWLSDRSAFIPVGGVGEWDRFCNKAGGDPIPAGDDLRFYYSGRNSRHGSRVGDRLADNSQPPRDAVGLGTIKRDRFAALEATFAAGTLRTKPLVFEGKKLHLNAAVKFGKLTVALIGADGKKIDEVTIEGQDGLDIVAPLTKLAESTGKPVRLEFTIANGQLYSFWFD